MIQTFVAKVNHKVSLNFSIFMKYTLLKNKSSSYEYIKLLCNNDSGFE